jgi:DNA-binding response OmpR family regulator
MNMNCTACDTAFEVGCPFCGTTIAVEGLGRRVALLALDRGESRSEIAAVLRALDFDLVIHASVRGLYEELTALRPDLAVLSVTLEDELAISITERARTQPELEQTKLLLLGSIFRTDRYRARPSHFYGAHAYLEPPIDAARLRRLILELYPEQASKEGPL